MRTTIDLPDELHRIASGIAQHTGRTLSQTVVDLIQRGLRASSGAPQKRRVRRKDPKTGLPLVRSPRPITDADVRALEDEP